MVSVFTVNAADLPFSEKDALRYAGAEDTPQMRKLISDAGRELLLAATPAVCGTVADIIHDSDGVIVGGFNFRSLALKRNLSGTSKAAVFAASLGIGVDRVILAASRTSPSRAVMLQGAAAEMVEALCDEATRRLVPVNKTKPRFSPGYGDLSLEAQLAFFSLLSPEKHMGLTLNASLMLSPSKSVTAIAGIIDKEL